MEEREWAGEGKGREGGGWGECVRGRRRVWVYIYTFYSKGHFKSGSNSPLMITKKTEK